jgi:hypothetical protein
MRCLVRMSSYPPAVACEDARRRQHTHDLCMRGVAGPVRNADLCFGRNAEELGLGEPGASHAWERATPRWHVKARAHVIPSLASHNHNSGTSSTQYIRRSLLDEFKCYDVR